MIFAVKMDFTRKARLVAGGQMTDPPTTTTYSSVVARDSVRVIFMIAGHNKIPVVMADIGNAYLNAPTLFHNWAKSHPSTATQPMPAHAANSGNRCAPSSPR